MATGTSRPELRLSRRQVSKLAAAAIAGVGALAAVGCGASHSAGAFSWLHPQAPPPSWTVVRIADGGELAYPASWRRQSGDPGTATAALMTGDRFLGYLNLTPRQGDETLSDWASFRVGHNRDEGDRAVRQLAAATGLRFRTGHGSCVEDSYTTTINAHFTEIACLVAGSHADAVIVGAAPPGRWAQESPVIERSIDGIRT